VNRRLVWALTGIAAVLVVGRLGTAAGLRTSFFTSGQTLYDAVAESLLHGHGFSVAGKAYVESPPVYPLLVSAAYAIGGHSSWSVVVLQTLLDLGSLLLLFVLGRRLFGTAAGLLAALMFALYPYLAGQAAILMDTEAFVFFLLAYLYLVVRTADTGRIRDAAGAGVAGGIAFLVRPTIFAILLVTPLLLVVLGRPWRAVVRDVAVIAGAVVLVATPWTVRNAFRFHAFVPGGAKLGENFYAGNSPVSAGYIERGISTDLVLVRPGQERPPARFNPVQSDNWWLHRGLDWVKAHPRAFVHGLVVKLQAFWSWDLNPRTHGDSRLKELLYTVSYLPLLLVALVSVARVVRPHRRRPLAFVAILLAAFTAIHVLLVGYTRVRAPLDPLLMLLAASLLVDAAPAVGLIAERLRRTARRTAVGEADVRAS
jgi:4-amino-4-deoxy-L-arabinose transferase-like glycosyltransferase